MNETRWRLHWRNKKTGQRDSDTLHCSSKEDTQARAEWWNEKDLTCHHWIEPELVDVPDLKPEPVKPAEQSWRLHWRTPEGNVGRWPGSGTFNHTISQCNSFNRCQSSDTHWIQPHETNPALKPGTEPIVWRVRFRNRESPHCGTKNTGTYATIAECQADIDRSAKNFPALDFWFQPELAPAEANPEPALFVNGCRITKAAETKSFWPETTYEVTIDGQKTACSKVDLAMAWPLTPSVIHIDLTTEPKPYERRWVLDTIWLWQGLYKTRLINSVNGAMVPTYSGPSLAWACEAAHRYLDMDARQADAKLDALYAEQK